MHGCGRCSGARRRPSCCASGLACAAACVRAHDPWPSLWMMEEVQHMPALRHAVVCMHVMSSCWFHGAFPSSRAARCPCCCISMLGQLAGAFGSYSGSRAGAMVGWVGAGAVVAL
jgi:hypothetical protein